MASTDMKIYEMSNEVEFESAFYFSKVFKKLEGVSPRAQIQRMKGSYVYANHDAGSSLPPCTRFCTRLTLTVPLGPRCPRGAVESGGRRGFAGCGYTTTLA